MLSAQLTILSAKAKYLTKTINNGVVIISWIDGGIGQTKEFSSTSFFQIGRFMNIKAAELAQKDGNFVNELTRYNRLGKDIKREVKSLGSVRFVARLIGVTEKSLQEQCDRGEENVDLIFALAIRTLTTKKNKNIIEQIKEN